MNTATYKTALEKELSTLQEELATVGKPNPNNPNDWVPQASAMDIDEADENEVADRLESYEDNAAIMSKLESRLNEVKAALQKIADGKFGNCEVCGAKIEADRLEANPAATTCKAHMNG